MADIPPTKKIKLSLERPWKDDTGTPLQTLLDIGPEGEQIYEPKRTASQILGENLERIFMERGIDFFENFDEKITQESRDAKEKEEADKQKEKDKQAIGREGEIMNAEELFKMRLESMPKVYTALGEMEQAMQLITTLLNTVPASSRQSSSANNPQSLIQQLSGKPNILPSSSEQPQTTNLTATQIKKTAPIPSVQAFNIQLNLGAKDQSLRKATAIFRDAATNLENSAQRNENYWRDALKLRRSNWGLIPAPLPFATANVKGADKLSKDVLVSYALEESPPIFKQRAIARMPDSPTSGLRFPARSNSRLVVSLKTSLSDGSWTSSRHHFPSPISLSPESQEVHSSEPYLQKELEEAQQEIVDEEVFQVLVKEAGSLPTASARVSERLVAVEVTDEVELNFELVEADDIPSEAGMQRGPLDEQCTLIYHILRTLLLRQHSAKQQNRLGLLETNQQKSTSTTGASGGVEQATTEVLHPIIDLLQYQSFCSRVYKELSTTLSILRKVGIGARIRFNPVADLGAHLISLLDSPTPSSSTGSAPTPRRIELSGSLLLHLPHPIHHTLRFTLSSPSTLTAHLPQTTMVVTSIPVLEQLLEDEMVGVMLRRISEVGEGLLGEVTTSRDGGGTWFVDLNRCVGRWEGGGLTFELLFSHSRGLDCTAYQVLTQAQGKGNKRTTKMEKYSDQGQEVALMSWVERVMRGALGL